MTGRSAKPLATLTAAVLVLVAVAVVIAHVIFVDNGSEDQPGKSGLRQGISLDLDYERPEVEAATGATSPREAIEAAKYSLDQRVDLSLPRINDGNTSQPGRPAAPGVEPDRPDSASLGQNL